jgi:hypothetical protein
MIERLQDWMDALLDRVVTFWRRLRTRNALPMTFEVEEPSAGTDEVVFESVAPNERELVCPVTRQTLQAGERIFRCRRCGLGYSVEGWEFMKAAERGRCCGCKTVNTVLPYIIPPTN